MLTKFLDPKNEIAFKRVFGTEKNKDILISFLKDILDPQDIGEIKDVTFVPSAQTPAMVSRKQSLVDVLCQDHKGLQYFVEMQVVDHEPYNIYSYATHPFIRKNYEDLQRVIILTINNFVMFPQKSAFRSEHVAVDRVTYEKDLSSTAWTFIELPKFTKKIEELTSISEKWYYYLKHAPQTTPEVHTQLVENSPVLQRAYQELEASSWSKDDLATYEQIKQRDNFNAFVLRDHFEKGLVQGKLAVATYMLNKLHLDVEVVQQATGLSQQTIAKLIQK